MKFLAKFEGPAYTAFRIVTGFLFLWHGTIKLLAYPAPFTYKLNPVLQYTAGSIEMIGGALVMIGLFTRPAAFLCSGLMAAAYWMAHGTKSLLPIVNNGELAVLYCFAFFFIACRGGSAFSLDLLRRR